MPSKAQSIIDDIQRRIRAGEWPPGHKLPSGRELREHYGVSQMTVRTAIDRLRLTGWIVTQPGAGAWVAQDPPTG